jgi:hypothetical protein
MSRERRLNITDDSDKSPATHTYMFSLGPAQYRIDLNTEHAAEFAADFAKYTAVAERLDSAGQARPAQVVNSTVAQRRACREWLRKNGHPEIRDFGMIPPALFARWLDATKGR